MNDEEKSLKRLASCVQNSKKYRDKKRKLIQKFCNQDEKVADALKSVNRAHVGRPSILEDHPQLLQTIADIVEGSSSADDRRRSETIRSCKTVSDVTEELIDSGIDISRSGTYLHVLPRIKNSIEGRRHVNTVPVKLLRPENSLRKKNVDRSFAKSICDDLKSIGPLFGPDAVNYISGKAFEIITMQATF